MRFGNPLSLLLAVLAGQELLRGVLAAPPAEDAVPAAAAAVDAALANPPAEPANTVDALPEVLELSAGDFHEKTAKGYW
jgi:hypothetical protein